MRNLYFSPVFLLFTFYLNAQVTERIPVQIIDIENKISEVYKNEITNLEADRITFIKFLLTDRIAFYKEKNTAQDKYTKLSEVTLYNKYNPDLKRDLTFDPSTFNPLKYNFNFYSQFTQVYRVDNSDIIIVIESQKRK